MSGSVEIDLASQARMIDALRISLRATQVLQTHLSYVVLTGGIAYKVKKAVDMGFLDFRSLASRRRDCDRELRIDRAFAPDLYLDVVAVTGSVDTPHIGGAGPVLDYAVRMREFPQEAVAAHALARGAIGPAWVDALAANIADAHLRAAVDTTRADAPLVPLGITMTKSIRWSSRFCGRILPAGAQMAAPAATGGESTNLPSGR